MQLIIHTSEKDICIHAEAGECLSALLEKAGADIAKPCGGNGTCGKCRVRVKGGFSPASADEQKLLGANDLAAGVRLACRTFIERDGEVFLMTQEAAMQGLTAGSMPAFQKDPLTGGKDCFAMAVDIGTTTVAGYFYQMPQCVCKKTDCRTNPQTAFGADVISRIQYAGKEGGAERLQKAVQTVIAEMVRDFGKPMEKYVITGNTTMLHFLTGLDAAGIAAAPFIPKSLFGIWQDNVYLPPCISAYVGADITTAVLASGLLQKPSGLLVDIGTNGEMAYWDGTSLTCCSTAAGPAFEGAGISCGMPALPGAIDRVSIENRKLKWHTIGNQPPKGICGSGLMDAAACMLRLGMIEDTGYAEPELPIGDSGIVLTAADVRQIQLAKAAIRAGIETLTENGNRTIDRLYIAGGFGSYVDMESCIRIGLLPPSVRGRVTVLGNAAGMGAAMILQSKEQLEEAGRIAAMAKTTELSSSAAFMDAYMEQMMFPEID